MKRYPEYRDSGIEWLGEVPAHWDVIRLKHTAVINPVKSGSGYKKDSEDLVTFLPMESVSEDGRIDISVRKPISELWDGFTYFAEGDTIVAKITPCFENGKGAFLSVLETPIGFGSTEFHVLRSLKGISNGRFLYYLTYSHFFRETGTAFMAGAAGQKRVPTQFVEEFLIALPPIVEQETLVKYLDRKTREIDALIQKKQALIELLREQRAAVINRAVTKGLDPNAPMKDSGIAWLGEVPAHWKVTRIKHVLAPTSGALKTGPFGSQLKGSDLVDSGIKVYTQRNVLDADFDHGDGYISDAKFQQLRDFETQPGDILVTTRGTIGRCAILPEGAERGVLHPCLIKVQVDEAVISRDYLTWFIQHSTAFRQSVLYNSNATTIEVIYGSTLRDVQVTLPLIHEQHRIVAFLKSASVEFDILIKKERTNIDLLKELRTSLISEVVTGKIDVREAVEMPGVEPEMVYG